MIRTPALNIIVGVSAFSLAGIIMYIWYKNRDDEEDELDSPNDIKNDKKIKNGTNQKDITIKMVIPNDKVPIIVGRGGANLKSIESKATVIITFKDKDDHNQFCEIRGTTDAVNLAKELLSKEMNRSLNVKEEIFVPQSACGKIIGRCGESLQEICRKSLAKVSVDSGDRAGENSTRKIVITGNRGQVDVAKKLIEEKVKEDEEYRKNIEETELKREPRRSPTQSVSSLHSSMTSLASTSHLPSKEKLSLSESDKPFEVFVSAIASPAKFWLQLIGPQTKKLDQLVEDMTEYYNNEENQEVHKIADPYLGQIVAALFKYDGKWYRAEIVGILPNEYNPRDVVLDLYFVDYGDSEYVQPHEVFELRTDFLTLRFQAIECFLANTKPVGSLDVDIWDPTSIAKFEELTHVASWRKLKSRIVTYKDRPRGGNHIRREGSPVPGVELFDNIEGTEINIAHMLITHGFAMPDYPETQANYIQTNQIEETSSEHNTSHSSNNEPVPPPPPPRTYSQHIGNSNVKSPIMFNGTSKNNGHSILNNTKIESENFLKTEQLNGKPLQHGFNNTLTKANHTLS
ncbi:tudor and KH domain-containing protein homolog [Condylostylus longicornis]|uniref:tudor and KH domain-containing protein homolog n=1 Tax=Condylostylus longicornis TaxID=2530218 RepID=UPI00244DC67E|nr:tudor and KH domain-containing protein homolog [Condylostylus longicornis]XP_055386417.1 tudor and KH domain-containing protein homolog [Condylostylus longicornis]XP_055386418.1 tudor and KH domain-containing protein homolog [Condylostylus longicornis]